MKDAIDELAELAGQAVASLEHIAAEQGEIELPGYTPHAAAMPSSVKLWADGYAAELATTGTAARGSATSRKITAWIGRWIRHAEAAESTGKRRGPRSVSPRSTSRSPPFS